MIRTNSPESHDTLPTKICLGKESFINNKITREAEKKLKKKSLRDARTTPRLIRPINQVTFGQSVQLPEYVYIKTISVNCGMRNGQKWKLTISQ